jgi:predicted lipid-binding transport protein (Tim44 family)
MAVVVLLALIWAMLLVPPALRAHAARQEAFLLSIGSSPGVEQRLRPTVARSLRVQRRRHIAGGLVVAMAATLLIGLLPSFRILLVVHLFLVDSFIAYIGLLAYWADRAAVAQAQAPVVEVVAEPAASTRRRRWNRERLPAPAVLPDLASLG